MSTTQIIPPNASKVKSLLGDSKASLISPLESLQWLASQGARFALPRGRTKDRLEKGWPKNPHTLEEAIEHTHKRGNVGILTGTPSSGIIAIDIDINFEGQVEDLGELAKTAKIVRTNAPGRGKILYQVMGRIPSSHSWKVNPHDPKEKPAVELLSTGRHALCPPSEVMGGDYVLLDMEAGILGVSREQVDGLWLALTGESLTRPSDVEGHSSNGTGGVTKSPYVAKVKEAWPNAYAVFQRFGKAHDERKERGGQLRLLGNGGLIVGDPNGQAAWQWFCFTSDVGGDVLDAWAWCRWGRVLDRSNRQMFWDVINEMGDAAGIPRPQKEDIQVTVNGKHPEAFLPAHDERFHETDLGNAKRLVKLHGEDLRYIAEWGKWFVWDGAVWEEDNTIEIARRAKATVGSIYAEASKCSDQEMRKALGAWGRRSEAQSRIEAMIESAKSEPEIAITHGQLEHGMETKPGDNDWLLNCENGVIDLRAGRLLPHDRRYLFTKRLAVAYDPEATCPRWEAFVSEIMGDDLGMVDYLWRAIGYSLTSDTREQCLFFCYGEGKNGKSTFTETIMALLGVFAQKAPTRLILSRYNDNSVPTEVARLVGKRFVVTSEAGDHRLNEELVKDLTGGDRVTARFMRQDYFEFHPTHKLWIYGNHKPAIRNNDEGIWRRVRLIPFEVQFSGEVQDKDLKAKLHEEMPGILAWAVRGCLEWQKRGLEPPQKVKTATNEYRTEMDDISSFIEECCERIPNYEQPFGVLYKAYVAFCAAPGSYFKVKNNKRFAQELEKRGFGNKNVSGYAYRVGIMLKVEVASALDEGKWGFKLDVIPSWKR